MAPEAKPRRRLRHGFRHPWRLAAAGLVVVLGLTAGGALYGRSVIAGIAQTLPPTPNLATLPVSVAVVDRSGQLLRPFTTDGGRWRLPVALGDVDRHFIAMLIGYEDRHFQTHRGIDWTSMLR